MSHLALQVGPSNWVHKTRIHSIQRWHHFGAKTSRSTFLLEKQFHPFLYWIKYSWSGSTHILYYINLSVRWNTLLRNQISLCQHVFYYTYNCHNMFIVQAYYIICSFSVECDSVIIKICCELRWKENVPKIYSKTDCLENFEKLFGFGGKQRNDN